MEIRNQAVEQQITIHDEQPFVSKQDVPAGDGTTPAYTIEGPEGYIIGVDAGTPVAPEFRDSSGEKLDGSTRVTIQKCDKQGNPLGDGIVFNDQLSRFDFEEFRTDPDYFRSTQKQLMVDEREIVKIFVDVPSGANGFNADNSNLTIGDDTSDFGKPVDIVDHDDLTGAESQAVKRASQNGGR
jgi:hypothetical protein